MKLKKIVFFLILSFLFVLNGSEFAAKKAVDGNSFEYEYVTNDPYNGRIYTLKNGLKVYLARIPVKPRIVVRFLVKAGLADSPADATCLAHYLEHLMFKGTNHFGTLDWAKEQKELKKIEELYEVYNHTTDPAKRKWVDALGNECP